MNNNATGGCGIAGGDAAAGKGGVKIMSIQIFYGNGGASVANTAKGMQYAADNGAHILQNSWGYDSYFADKSMPSNDAAYKRMARVEAEAIDYFIANAGDESGPMKGGLAIFAAGNESAPMAGFPGAAEYCVSVAATSADFTPATYTNYGPGTTISAPGGDQDYYFEYAPVDANGNALTNDFIEKFVIDAYIAKLAKAKEDAEAYNKVVAQIEALVNNCNNAQDLNGCILQMKDFNHIGSSKDKARYLISNRAKALNVSFDKTSGMYV